jgi:hypothetical protein
VWGLGHLLSSDFFGLVDGDAMPSHNDVEPVVRVMDHPDFLSSILISGSRLSDAASGGLH